MHFRYSRVHIFKFKLQNALSGRLGAVLPILVNRCTRADSSRSTPKACTEWLQPAGEGKGAPCLSWGLGRGPDVPHMSEVCKQLLDVLSSLTPLLWPREPWLSLGHKERDSGFNAQAFMHWQMSKPAELYEEQKQVSVSPTQSRFQSETVLFLMSFVEFWIKQRGSISSQLQMLTQHRGAAPPLQALPPSPRHGMLPNNTHFIPFGYWAQVLHICKITDIINLS